MRNLKFSKSEKVRLDLTKKQQKEISDLYSDLVKTCEKEANKLKDRENVSSTLRRQQLDYLKKELNAALEESNQKLHSTITKNMKNVAESVVEDNKSFLKSVGMTVTDAFSQMPREIVEKVSLGKLYEKNWSLTRSLWKDVDKKKKDINKVVASGIAMNKSAFAIAKDLEKYVDPKARKSWEWSKVYPGTTKKVDYVAQRLARTMVSHAYQQSIVDTVANNPFISGIKWRSALIHERTCDLCRERNGRVFNKETLPLDHPNGLCTFLAMTEPLDKVADRIGDWYNGKKDKDLDKFAVSIGAKSKPKLGVYLDKKPMEEMIDQKKTDVNLEMDSGVALKREIIKKSIEIKKKEPKIGEAEKIRDKRIQKLKEVNTKLSKLELDRLKRPQLELLSKSVAVKNADIKAITAQESLHRIESVMDGNSTEQLKKYILKYGNK